MPSTSPTVAAAAALKLAALGAEIRGRRKALGVRAVAACEAAGISRPTLHRIEKGGPAVTIGAWLQVMGALGLTIEVRAEEALSHAEAAPPEGWLPARIRPASYPWLRQLAWHVQGPHALTPREAFDIYQRNRRDIEATELQPAEKHLIEALRLVFADDASTGSEGEQDV